MDLKVEHRQARLQVDGPGKRVGLSQACERARVQSNSLPGWASPLNKEARVGLKPTVTWRAWYY